MNYRFFIELLQVSLGTLEQLSNVPSTNEWEALIDESDRQAILGVMLDGLERLPVEQRPYIDLFLEWIGEVLITEETNKLHQKRARELTKRFLSVGFRSCVLKGVGTALLYPNPLRRQGGDIDFWVSGSRKDVTAWMRTQCEVGYMTWHHTDAHFFDEVDVEVHFRPSWLYNPRRFRKIEKYFESEKLKQMAEREEGFNYPTPVFNAVFSMTHAFHHLLEEGVGFRHIVDYYYIVKILTADERKEVMQVIEDIRMEKFMGALMYVLHEACGMASELLLCEPNEKEGKFLLNEVQAAGNFGYDRKGEQLNHNSIKRFWVMAQHYPSEVAWMIPWKVYQLCWRQTHKII